MADKTLEKAPLQSKKFIAYLVSELTTKLILLSIVLVSLYNGDTNIYFGGISALLILVGGFVTAGYIIGQASLDKYIRVADIATNGGKNLQMKGMTLSKGEDE